MFNKIQTMRNISSLCKLKTKDLDTKTKTLVALSTGLEVLSTSVGLPILGTVLGGVIGSVLSFEDNKKVEDGQIT